MSGVFVGASLGFFPFHYDAGSALLGGGLDAFRFLFFIGSFSHCLRRATQWVCQALRGHDGGFLLSLFSIQSAMCFLCGVGVQSCCTYKYITVSGTDRHFCCYFLLRGLGLSCMLSAFFGDGFVFFLL